MFGGKKMRAIQARLDRLEESLSTMQLEVRSQMERALASIEQDPAKRLALLVDGIESALGERVAALEPRIVDAERTLDRAELALAPVRGSARHSPEYGVEHEAAATGLLGLWFDGGYNDKILILVNGYQVARVNSSNDLCSSFAMVIRGGERYRLESESMAGRGETGWKTMFTPFGP